MDGIDNLESVRPLRVPLMIPLGVLLLFVFRALDAQLSCPCDLVTGACELSCCCDTDCTSGPTQHLALCSPPSVALDTLRIFPRQLLAVSRDNSPFLGLFYPNPVNITPQIFESLVSRHQPFKPPLPTFPPSSLPPQYRYGDPILATTDDFIHYLYYTSVGPFGACVLSPISYLRGSEATCSSSQLSVHTHNSVSYRYLCANYTNWMETYSPHSPHTISLTTPTRFSQCSADIPSCLSSNRCPHLLLSSSAVISWFQGAVLRIQQDMLLLTLPTNLPITSILQSHSVSYEFTSNRTLDTSFYHTAADGDLLPGYVRGAGLLFGTLEGSTGYIRRSTASLISSSSGLCSAIVPRRLEFQNNVLSGCHLRIPSGSNCSDIRQELMDLFSLLLPATYVARSRRSSILLPEHWVPLLRPPPDAPSNSSLCSLPSHLHTRYLYTHAGGVGSYQILEVTGATAQLEYHNIAFLHTIGEFAITVSTSAEFIQVPVTPPSPLPRSSLRHTANCQEPCYAPDQVFYPLYQSMSLRGLDPSLTRFLSFPSLSDGLYFSFTLALSTLYLLYLLVNSFLF